MEKEERDGVLRLSVVFNNVPLKPGLETSWGFSCLVQGAEKTVLFDTGGDGGILLSNMKKLGLDAVTVEIIVLSHHHWDHTGGIGVFPERDPPPTVYMPVSFPESLRQEVRSSGGIPEAVSGPLQLAEKMYSTGEMGSAIREQALVIDTPRGLVVMTGCAHPGIAEMAEHAVEHHGRGIHLLMGGYHLRSKSETEIRRIIERLKALGVKRVAPSHCTGDTAIRMFREAWAVEFVEGGLGAVIKVTE